ncbi:MAG: proline--tRNA ligase [Halobacteriales archaeon]|nr:proline--tRNA ligase [Halobacteriales archaeon]
MPATTVPKSKDFMEWYNEVVEVAELTDKRYPIKGMNIWRPYGQRIMGRIDQFTRQEMERTRHDEVSFPLMIPEKLFMKEADQIKGFGSEVFWVTHAGDNALPDGERWVVRPTSECAMYEIFPLWIRSHGDLPLQTFQICNVFRYETKQTRAFMRVREIHFFEDHSVFADETTAREHVELDLAIVGNVYQKLALPALYSRRPDWDKFPGAVDSTGADVVMPSGRTLQCATVHYYGENFARAYGMKYELGGLAESMVHWMKAAGMRAELLTYLEVNWNPGGMGFSVEVNGRKYHFVTAGQSSSSPVSSNVTVVKLPQLNSNGGTPVDIPEVGTFTYRGTHAYCHQTTYGMSERLVGAIVGCHGDDNGLILPPEIAPFQVVIVPVLFKEGSDAVLAACRAVKDRLAAAGLRVELDDRPKTSGEKYYHWELRGVPLRLEVGPKDVEKKSAFAARRDMGKEGKRAIPLDGLEAGVNALLADIQKALFERQAAFVQTRVKHPKTLDEARALDAEGQKAGVGYILAMPICCDNCAAQVEKGLDIKTLGVPAGMDKAHNKGGPCGVCGTMAKDTLRFARTY